ncbi:MAG: cold shock domain-containing protein, partial [Comamonas sp.]|nr:cold shock domain-containing protein [Comamonas sp.]
MLLEGTLQSWNDERGFGFIAPDGGGPPVFVHISAFQTTAARPQARQRLSYVLDKPAGDKPRASRARVLG